MREIFASVCQQTGDDRLALLDNLCGDEPELRSEVESLLCHLERPAFDIEYAASSLGGLIADAVSNGDAARHLPPTIGPYRILRFLGEGGMGVVYLAEQERPRRTVAIKVIRPGFATPSLVRRFEHEANVLGRLHHPGIAQIFNAGVAQTNGGLQPFLVMEYCDGLPLLEYAQHSQIGIAPRVQLMVDICEAVQHAHVRGVIHRDLKPANIVVIGQSSTNQEQVDRAESRACNVVPKILDFGVARVVDADAQAGQTSAPFTVHGQLIGTLAYMSPEQLTGDVAAIDTRSDVYSLGVICFELLSGSLPYESKGRSAETLRVLHEQPRMLGDIDPALRGDLQTIVLKAMSPLPERRYQSAYELADDMRRYLHDEPISARRDSVAYLVRKQLRRYRGVVAVILTALIAVSLFAVHALNQASQNAALANAEREAREEAQTSQQVAALAEQHATQRRDESQAVTRFLMTMLKLADPDVTDDFDISVRTLLAQASKEISGSFERFPQAEADVRGHLGRIYATLGDLDEAEAHLRRAIALHDWAMGNRKQAMGNSPIAHSPLPIASRDAVADRFLYGLLWPYLHVQLDLNDVVASASRLRAERLGRAMLGTFDRELERQCVQLRRTARRTTSAEDLQTLVDTFRRDVQQRFQPAHEAWLLAADQLHLLGLSHRLSDHPSHAAVYFQASLDLYRQALAETNTRIARTHGELTDALLNSSRFDEALSLARQSLTLLRRMLNEDHWYLRVYEARLGRAMLHTETESAAAAEAILQRCCAVLIAARGEASPLVMNVQVAMIDYYTAMNSVGKADLVRAQYALGLAKSAVPAVFEQMARALGPNHARLIASLRDIDLSITQRAGADADEAIADALQYCAGSLDASRAEAAAVADVLAGWAGQQAPRRLSRESRLAMLHEARRIAEVCPHLNGRKAAGTYWWLAELYERTGDGDSCVRFATLAVEHLKASRPVHDTFIPVAESLLAGGYTLQGRNDEAFEVAQRAYIAVRAAMGLKNLNTSIALNRYIVAASRVNQIEASAAVFLGHLQQLVIDPPAVDVALATAWHVAHQPDLPQAMYEAALKLSEQTQTADSQRLRRMTTIGISQYRLGRFNDAVATLSQADVDESATLETLAFLSMACVQANLTSNAAHYMSRLEQMRSHDDMTWPHIAELLYNEASAVHAGGGASNSRKRP